MRKAGLVITVIFALIFCAAAFADQAQDNLKMEAYNKIKVAQEIFVRANSLLGGTPTKENLATALQLYAQAGQLFQEGGNILTYLGPSYVNPQDGENCKIAAQTCLKNIQMIRETLNNGR
jgi:hypothetical protein